MKNSPVLKWSFFIVLGISYFLFPNSASAEDFYFFRIDSELDVPVAISTGATARWRCNGTGEGIVTDNTASESTQALDGIVKVASTSAENDSSHAGCNGGESIVGSVSMDGWRYRNFTGTVTSAGSNITFTIRASMDYTILVNGVTDELGTAITLNGTTASATYSGTVASQSYSGGKRYIAGSTSGGTVTGGADGYVNRTSSALTISSTATQSVDFGASADSDLDESGLLFGHKVQVYEIRTTFATGAITSGTVTAGNSYGTTCTAGTGSNAGYWYCPVPLSNTETSAKFSNSSYETTTGNYSDRSVGSDGQTQTTIAPYPSYSGGGGGSYTPPEATPTPTPTPTLSPEPTPTPTTTPLPPIQLDTPAAHNFVSLAALNIHEGDTVSAAGSDDPDIYIPNEHGYKRLFLNPVIFNFYGHLGGFVEVKNVPAQTRNTLVTSGLFRNCENDDPKVFGLETTGEDVGMLHWVNTTGEQAVADDSEFFKKVFCINSNEFNWYPKGSDYTSVNQVPVYSR